MDDRLVEVAAGEKAQANALHGMEAPAMRLFGITSEEAFQEYVETDFQVEYRESILENWLENNAQYHREYFQLAADEAITFNKDQRIVLVGQRITPEIRQTSAFLNSKGVRVTCVEFTFFETGDRRRLLSSDIVVGREPTRASRVTSSALPQTTEAQFLESLDEYGRPVFTRLLGFVKSQSYVFHWGSKGFSMNVDLDGTHVAFGYGYPPRCVFKQSVYSALAGQGGLLSKIEVPARVLEDLSSAALDTGLFQPAGRELKYVIDRRLSESEIDSLISWFGQVASTIKQFGLKGQSEQE